MGLVRDGLRHSQCCRFEEHEHGQVANNVRRGHDAPWAMQQHPQQEESMEDTLESKKHDRVQL
eukprot:scaffold30212_cov58-Phaeocystis_antarctica.AAC.1